MFKKVFCLFILSTFIVIPIFSQETEDENTVPETRNDFQLYGGAGFGIYSMKNNDKSNNNFLTATGIYSLGAYYSISNKFYFGIGFDRLGFATNRDSAQSANVKNLALLLKYNIRNSEKSSIHFNAAIGTTAFKYLDNKTNTNVTASSLFIEPGIGYDHFWGKHFGYFINTSYYYTRYTKIVNKDNNPLTVINNGFEEQLWISLSGMHLKIGFMYKF
ncbi:MAG: hypothetical protein Fur0028_09770 [Bacteroidales bacterium]